VVKLDRLTRSLLDLGELLSRYFAGERYYLMSVSESLDTRTAMGRFVLYILGLIAQWEREAIGERTRESMSHLKSLGVYLGAAPFGFRYSREVDADGRKRLVEIPEQQAVLLRILAMFDARDSTPTIAEKLSHENIPAPKGGTWDRSVVRRILERHQRPVKRKPQKAYRGPRVWDKERATALSLALRADGLSLRAIGERLDEAGLSPPRGGTWHAATVMEILGAMSAPAAVDVRTRAQQLRASGSSLRAIARQLLAEGYHPARSTTWHAASVQSLLTPNESGQVGKIGLHADAADQG
jgi:DNA invertase Pin-like site-specific DNA recombinase